jgi:hypothetical protein
MVTLWNIAIDKVNPDGTPKGETSETFMRSEKDKVLEEDARSTAGHQPQAGSVEDPDTEEHVDYETVNDKQVIVRKRTKYRIWKEFENGRHSMLRYVPSHSSANLCTDDTCVQPGYWAAVWEFVNSLAPLSRSLLK